MMLIYQEQFINGEGLVKLAVSDDFWYEVSSENLSQMLYIKFSDIQAPRRHSQA